MADGPISGFATLAGSAVDQANDSIPVIDASATTAGSKRMTFAEFFTSRTMVTPVLGVATATSINKVAFTAPATSATVTVADGKTFTCSNTLTFTGTDSSSVAFGAGGTVVYTSGYAANVATFLATPSSVNLKAAVTDETGSGALVFADTPTLVAPLLGTPTSGTLTNCTGLPVAGGGTGRATGTTAYALIATGTTATGAQQSLAAGATTEILVGGGASALPVWTAAQGSGAPVRATSPTITTPTFSGITVADGAQVQTASAMGALAVDVTKLNNTKSVSADSTLTFSGTPATAQTWFGIRLTNTDTAAHVITIPSSFSMTRNAAVTTVPVAASGKIKLIWEYDGSVYNVYGDSGQLNNYTATAAPAVTDDLDLGYGVGSVWIDVTGDDAYVCVDASNGAAVWNAIGGGGSGTVTNTGGNLTSNAVVLGAGSADSKVSTGFTTDGTSILTLGVAGASVGTVAFKNATSGTLSLIPVTGALGTVTLSLPATTGTIALRGDKLSAFAATSSSELKGVISDETGSGGALVFATAPTLTGAITLLNAVPGTDDTYEGQAITGRNAGATIAQWEAVYLGSGGTWLLADANGSGTYPCRGLATAAYVDTNAAVVIDNGTVRNDAWNWTIGGDIYLSATAGGLTQTAPSTSGDKIQKIGYALSADTIRINIGTGEYLTVT